MKKVLAHIIGFCVLLCFCVSITNAQETQADKTTSFHEIKGKVVDSKGKPIEKFSVTVQVYDYSKGGWSVTPETVGKWEGEFENGEFRFDIEDLIKINDKTYINRTVSVAGYMETSQRGGFKQLATFKGNFGKIKLSRAMKITGKLVLPTGQTEEELVDPKIHIAKKLKGMVRNYNNEFQRTAKVDEDGNFETLVPENCKLNITASCDNAATVEKTFTIRKSESKEDEQDLGEIKLKEGISVSGIVVNRDGEPVEGQIVKLQQMAGRNNLIKNIVYGYAISDSDGKFKLPPREGECTVALVKQAYIDGKQVKVKGKLLMAKELTMKLKVGDPVEVIEIRESKTWKISGVIKYDKTIGMTPLIRSSASSGQQYELELDEEGNFEIEVVDESKPWLSVYAYKGSKIYMATMSKSSLNQFEDRFNGNIRSERMHFQLKEITSDIGPLEFTLREQFVDDRSVSERLFDWYYFGE